MKAFVISEMVSEGGIAHVHGIRFKIERILIPEAHNLLLTPHGETFYAFTFGREVEDYQVIREIDIPGELVEKALTFIRLEKELIETCAALIGEGK